MRELNDEFMLGRDLLIAPVVEQGATKRLVTCLSATGMIIGRMSFSRAASTSSPTRRSTSVRYTSAPALSYQVSAQQFVGEIPAADLKLIVEIYGDGGGRGRTASDGVGTASDGVGAKSDGVGAKSDGCFSTYRDNGTDYAYEAGEYKLYHSR